MRKIWAIAQIAIRSSVRSRVMIVMTALLLLAIVGLPLTIKGDGTIQGHVQIMLGYTLNAIILLMGIATVWAGCSTVSSEIQEKQIHLVATKPVHRWQIWAGKWLGLLMINGSLLAFSGLVIYGLALWTLRPGRLDPADLQILREELLVARTPMSPVPDDMERQIGDLVTARMAEGDLPTDISTEELRLAFRNKLLNQSHTLEPDSGRSWMFEVPKTRRPGHPHLLRYRFGSSEIGPAPIPATWSFGRPGENPDLEIQVTNTANRVYTLHLPESLAEESGTIQVGYINHSPDGTTVIFPHTNGLELLRYEGGFFGNLIRGLALVFFRLSLLAAVALTAGTLLSLPVAALTSGYAVVLLQFAPYIKSVAIEEGKILTVDGFNLLDAMLHVIFYCLNVMVKPLSGPNPTELLALGQTVAGSVVLQEFLVKIVVYSGLTAVIGSWLFKRRELALHGR